MTDNDYEFTVIRPDGTRERGSAIVDGAFASNFRYADGTLVPLECGDAVEIRLVRP